MGAKFTTDDYDLVWQRQEDLENILRNIRNGGFNAYPLESLLEDIKMDIEGFDGLLMSFKSVSKTAKDIHNSKLDMFLEEAIDALKGERRRLEDILASSHNSQEYSQVKNWLNEQSEPEEYLAENGHSVW